MRSRYLITCLIVPISLLACSSEDPQKPQEETAPMAEQPTQSTPETPAEAASSEQTESQPQAPISQSVASETPASETPAAETPASQPAPALNLGPGQTKVTASVVSVETKGASHICTLKIENVHGYGSASKPLASGNEIRVNVKNAQVEAAGDGGQALLKAGSTVDITMRYQKPPAISPPPPSWSLVEVH